MNVTRWMPVLHALGAGATRVEGYVSGTDVEAWYVEFDAGRGGLGHSSRIWTNRKGIEALRDLCNVLLVSDLPVVPDSPDLRDEYEVPF